MVNEKPTKSASFSLKGYNFKTWIYKNSVSIKNIITAMFGVSGLVTSLTTQLPVIWVTFLTGLSVLVGKFLCDFIDYLVTKEPA